MAVAPSAEPTTASFCSVGFEPGPVALAWAYHGLAGEYARAVVDLPSGHAVLVAARLFRRLAIGRTAVESLRADLLRLEQPGDPWILRHGAHRVLLLRPWVPVKASPPVRDDPIVLDVGDRRTFFAFAHRDSARDFARHVRKLVGHHPPWTPYLAESWPVDSSPFRPRPALNGRGTHGLTVLEEILGDVLVKEKRLAIRRARRRRDARTTRSSS